VPITTKVVSSKPIQGKVYSIQQYVIEVCRWFSLGTPVSSTNKTGHHNINEILLQVAFNTLTQMDDDIFPLLVFFFFNKILGNESNFSLLTAAK
jgi:hypothetical protein